MIWNFFFFCPGTLVVLDNQLRSIFFEISIFLFMILHGNFFCPDPLVVLDDQVRSKFLEISIFLFIILHNTFFFPDTLVVLDNQNRNVRKSKNWDKKFYKYKSWINKFWVNLVYPKTSTVSFFVENQKKKSWKFIIFWANVIIQNHGNNWGK